MNERIESGAIPVRQDAGRRRRIVVIGAGGFIGSPVLEALSASDWAEPVGCGRRRAPPHARQIPWLRIDATDPQQLARALDGAAAVVNCVAGDAGTIVSSARNLHDACSRTAARPRIVHLSSMAVYGSLTGRVDESAELRGDWDDYSAAKAQAERVLGRYGPLVCLRPGIVYGPGSPIWSEQIGRWLLAHRLGDLGAAGTGLCNLVHVEDVVNSVLRALQLPGIEGEAFNLGSAQPPSWNDYFRRYAVALRTECRRISPARLALELNVLAPPLKLAGIAARLCRIPWQPPAPIRPWLLRLCRHPIRMAVDKAEALLGIRWTPLERGLASAAEHYWPGRA